MNAAALIDTTLLDGNTAGATSVVGGGRLLTYGNNRIVGSAGSGFTGSAALQSRQNGVGRAFRRRRSRRHPALPYSRQDRQNRRSGVSAATVSRHQIDPSRNR